MAVAERNVLAIFAVVVTRIGVVVVESGRVAGVPIIRIVDDPDVRQASPLVWRCVEGELVRVACYIRLGLADIRDGTTRAIQKGCDFVAVAFGAGSPRRAIVHKVRQIGCPAVKPILIKRNPGVTSTVRSAVIGWK